MDDEVDTAIAMSSSPIADVAIMANSLNIVADQIAGVTRALGDVAQIIETMTMALDVMARAIRENAVVSNAAMETIRTALRTYFEERGRVRVQSRYVPSGRLVDLRRGDVSAYWSAILAQLRRTFSRPYLHNRLVVLTAQPNGPNRPIASRFIAIEPLSAA
jgi:hypothetical protein